MRTTRTIIASVAIVAFAIVTAACGDMHNPTAPTASSATTTAAVSDPTSNGHHHHGICTYTSAWWAEQIANSGNTFVTTQELDVLVLFNLKTADNQPFAPVADYVLGPFLAGVDADPLSVQLATTELNAMRGYISTSATVTVEGRKAGETISLNDWLAEAKLWTGLTDQHTYYAYLNAINAYYGHLCS